MILSILLEVPRIIGRIDLMHSATDAAHKQGVGSSRAYLTWTYNANFHIQTSFFHRKRYNTVYLFYPKSAITPPGIARHSYSATNVKSTYPSSTDVQRSAHNPSTTRLVCHSR